MRKSVFVALAVALICAPLAAAQDHGAAIKRQEWSFDGPFGKYDRNAVQRGFLVYQRVCASCHAMNHLHYRNLAEPGGPFTAYRVHNEETGAEELSLENHGHGGAVAPNDNLYVRAIAADVQIDDVNRETGEVEPRPGVIADRFRNPYKNPAAAAAGNGGAIPPDLSVINLARVGGADYIYALLTGYTGEENEGRYVNHAFAGGLIGMPPPLTQAVVDAGNVAYEDGTEVSVEQMARDVTHFLQWAADPHMEQRKSMAVGVMFFLLILSVLTYLSYKSVWRSVKH